MRGFYVFGIAVSVLVILATFGLEGDPLARRLFQAGMAWFGLANATILWMARSSRPIDARVTSAHFALAGVGLLPALYYFGPFSAVTLAFPLALMFVALDRDRLTANVVLAVALAEHTIVAVPIIVGWTRDVGLASIATSNRTELVIVEALVLALIASGHALGRFARRSSAAALAELASARRMIGDQKQVITEAQDRVEQVNRLTAGRWTGQTVGRWRIGTVLGRGAMGEVYEANDGDGREAAV